MELAVRLVVATVLAWAALAKLRAGSRFVASLRDHGVPRGARRPAAFGLVAVESALAAMLVAGVGEGAAGYAVLALGSVFALMLLRTRLRGTRRTACGCFGGTRPRNTVFLIARALVLAGLGALIATGVPTVPAASRDTWIILAVAGLGAVVATLTLLVMALYRQVGVLSLRLTPHAALELEDEGPAIGQVAPMLTGLNRAGGELVAFVSLNCRLCIEVLPGLRALAREGLPVHWVREDADEAAFERWGVPGTPYVAYVVDGVVRSKGLVNTLEQIDWVIDAGSERQRAAA